LKIMMIFRQPHNEVLMFKVTKEESGRPCTCSKSNKFSRFRPSDIEISSNASRVTGSSFFFCHMVLLMQSKFSSIAS
jgi:hypothetical protein